MKAIIGIGVPGSGKTTFLRPLAEAWGLTYVNADDIRQEVNGDPSDHSRHLYIMRLFHERAAEGLESGGVVLDATYSRQRDRIKAIEFCRQHGATEVVGYWFDVPTALAIERNASRHRVVPEAAIYAMFNRLKVNPPTINEGFDEIVVI